MPSTDDLRNWWAPHCASSRMSTIAFGNAGAKITVDRRTVNIWRAVEGIMAKYGYKIRQSDTGAYNCRQITGGSGYSLHAYGIAVDVNWSTNPYGPNLVTDMPPGMILEIEALRQDGQQLVQWGGRYSSNKDAMHFEVIVSPTIAARFHSVAENWVLKEGSTGHRVNDLEQLLVHIGFHEVIVDGRFGPATKEAVKDMQRLLKAQPSGTVGAFTFAAIERWFNVVGAKPKAYCVGDQGPEIRAVKKWLARSFNQRLVSNGRFTGRTQKSVFAAQKFLRLRRTGNLDILTIQKIKEWDDYAQSKNKK